MNDFLIVIPARYESTRFPGKPLVNINGKTMLQRVCERCIEASSINNVIVATDDSRINDHCNKIGIQVVLTSKDCLTGTDRIYEGALKIKADRYINVQGDEPLISVNDINLIISESNKYPTTVINAMCPILDEEDYKNPNVPKVVVNNDGIMLYMSRAPIPNNKENKFIRALKQVCIYAFPREALIKYGLHGKKTELENIEDIEILRLLEMGFKIKMVEVSDSSIAVDTPEDLERVKVYLDKND